MKRDLESVKEVVDKVFERCQNDSRFKVSLRKLGSKTTETMGWWALSELGVDLTKTKDVIVTSFVFSAIARSGLEKNGNIPIGKAVLLACSKDSVQNGKERGSSRIRTLLSCHTENDYTMALHPLISLIDSRNVPLDFASLLYDLLSVRYPDARERIRARWANDFYSTSEEDMEEKP